jgi:hypothetical protein
MRVPFTVEQFLDVFRRYNEAVWPAQWILTALGVAAVVLALGRAPHAGRMIGGLLALLWLWMGAVYHLTFFRPINPAATAFGAVFLVQAALLAWLGVWRGALDFQVRRDAAGLMGALVILYALVLYPAIGHALGHRYPAAPTFGVPCPTTILTFGLLLWARPPVPRRLLIVPALWAVIGTTAVAELGMREDFGLSVAAIVATVAIVMRRSPRRRTALRPA